MSEYSDPIYHDEDAARAHLEAIRWPNGTTCPHCGAIGDKVYRLAGKGVRPGAWHCKACRKQFSVTVGTVFERSHVPLHKWVLATHLMAASKKGVSAHQLHRTLGVTYKTAWFMAHRIREAMKDDGSEPMGGKGQVVEADETFIGPPGYRFDGAWLPKRGRGEKRVVFTLVERGGRARSVKLKDLSGRKIRQVLVTNASRDSVLSTDEAGHYKRVGKEFARHFTVNHAKGEYARGFATTNTVEGFFSIFKRGMKGIYQHCGEQHLHRYLQEFDFRYSNRQVSDKARTMTALAGIEGRRLMYRGSRLGA